RSEGREGVTVWRLAEARWRSPGVRGLAALGLWWSARRWATAMDMRRALAELRHLRLQVIEAPECGAEALLLARRDRRRLVVRFHSPAELIMRFYETRAADRRLAAAMERRALRRAQAWTSPSRFLAAEAAARYGLEGRIRLVPNGVRLGADVDGDGVENPREPEGEKAPVVLVPGRLEPRKGIEIAGEVAAALAARRAITVRFLGEDLFGAWQRELVPRLPAGPGRAEHVARVAPGEARRAMARAAVVLLPSRWENAPYALLEAMAAGAPVVASTVGGVPEMVEDGREALLVPPGDPAATAAAVERLLDDPGRAARLGRAARVRVERDFGDAAMAESSLDLYREVTAAGEDAGR
ncbi:MAG TPA: glycosyltransferase family 4 protein, partial [Thermoanaerobaculia bacterium]|nr:glycosyltransferase family 4 protein [Thermoanaerobaculia bacterium]